MDSYTYVPPESGFTKRLYIDTPKNRIPGKFILEEKSFAIYSQKEENHLQIPGGRNTAGSFGWGRLALEGMSVMLGRSSHLRLIVPSLWL